MLFRSDTQPSEVLSAEIVVQISGLPVFTYAFAKGTGRISIRNATRFKGKVTLTTIRYLGTDDGAAVTAAVLDVEVDGPVADRRHHRPFGTDYAVTRRNAARRARDAAARLRHPLADRRRDDQPRAHGDQDRAALRRPGGLRAGRLALGVGGAVRVRSAGAVTGSVLFGDGELMARFGEYFEGGMGAEAIARLIGRIDLDVAKEAKARLDREKPFGQ